MAERDKYYIMAAGQPIEVSPELYNAYQKCRRKEKYFIHDLKEERTKIDRKTGKTIVVPGREDSYERLLEAEKQFSEDAESVEDAAVRAVMLERLNKALHTLTKEEKKIIYDLFYQETSLSCLADSMGIPWSTLNNRKKKILEKLKKNL